MIKFTCIRGHVTEVENPLVDAICCPQIEDHPKHIHYGQVCGRLAFAGKVETDDSESTITQ